MKGESMLIKRNQGRQPLDETIVKQIRLLHDKGYTCQSIADYLNIAKSTVSNYSRKQKE